MTVDPADATSADVRRALHRKFYTSGPSADPVDVAMSIAGPVIEAKDRRYERLREARDAEPANAP